MKYLFLLILILISGCSITGNIISEPKLEGPFLVIKVIDGDTLDLNNTLRVRFSGINTPETGECYYKEAKDKLTNLVLNKEVYTEMDKTDKDKYKRSLRYIYFNNTLINKFLVKYGYAKVYDKYKSDTKRYDELKEAEKNAISNNLGVWSCKDNKQDCLYVRSKNSKKYHTTACKFAKKILPENLVCYKSEEEVADLEFSNC